MHDLKYFNLQSRNMLYICNDIRIRNKTNIPMRKVVTLCLAIIALLANADNTLPSNVDFVPLDIRTYNAMASEQTASSQPNRIKSTELYDDDAVIYAFKKFGYGDMSYGFMKFQAQKPDNVVNIRSFSKSDGSESISSGTYVNGEYWVYVYQSWYGGILTIPVGIAVMDLETGEYEVKFATGSIHSYNEHFIEMTYDAITNKVYGVQYISDIANPTQRMMDLWVIDPAEGTYEPKRLGKVDSFMFGMAARNGVIYGITQDYFDNDISQPEKTRLIKFNPLNANEDGIFVTENIADLDGGNRVIRYDQSMEFDHATGKLWWAAQETANNGGYICEVDTTDGSLRHENRIPDASQYVALAIPYQIVNDNAPSYVVNFTASPKTDNHNAIELTWTNPSLDYRRNSLQSLDGVKIYRDGELIQDIKTNEVGREMIWTDENNLSTGNHIYRVLAYNNNGDGLWKERKAFAGIDVPGAVKNVTYEVAGDRVTINWEAPERGKNNGFYDTESLTYDVFRGTYKIASALTATTIEDKVNYYDQYVYKIVPVTKEGEGEPCETIISFGPATELPYGNKLSDEEAAEELMVVDANGDNHSWKYEQNESAYIYSAHYENVADDYLFLPTILAEKGKTYRLTFKYITSDYTKVTEDFEVVAATAANTESVEESIVKYENISSAQGAAWREAIVDYTSEKDKSINLAFHIYSRQGMGKVGITDILIREVEETEASAETINGIVDCYVDTPTEFKVSVKNTGTNDINSGIVKIVNEKDEQIASTTFDQTISPGKSAEITIAWTPQNEDCFRIYGIVELDNEQYCDDNKTHPLRISIHPKDGDKFITIGNADMYTVSDIVNFSNKQSRSQMLYYSDELNFKENVLITGIQFAYTPSLDYEYMDAVPVQIHIANTTQNRILDSVYEGSFIDQSTMTEVYRLDMDLSGRDETYNEVYVQFEQPFEYQTSKNLVVDVYKNLEDVFDNIGWYVDYSSGIAYRGAYWSAGYDYVMNPVHVSMNYVPYTKFSYKELNDVENIVNDKLLVKVTDTEIIVNTMANAISLYDLSGNCVIKTNKSDRLSTENISKGIYILYIESDNTLEIHKVLIK